ncbi:prenyltransferase/squalene oxidase repeat-containing protein [Singulisphaera sp. Ch08]|uniref:Prenyltransferase/squalene oxidase repeat-containing protein n=1 Tax=Singulisphaera sp. Ch08 TaxID=3120278 RepID=A0AAU7CSM0_9BACT
MLSRLITCVVMVTLIVLAIDARPARCEEPKKKAQNEGVPTLEQARKAIEQGLTFLGKDAVKWRQERGCATCHHGTMTVWALSEAKRQGYEVDAEALADTIQWTKDQFVPRISKPRDLREGWNLVSQPAIYLGVMSKSLPILSRDEVNQVASHLARYQEEDGAWLLGRPANASPPTWESRETVALLAYLAWEAYVPPDPKEAAAARVSREKAAAWLSQTKPTDTTQAAALRLLLDVQTGKSAEQLQLGIDRLLRRQNQDGGWSQLNDMPSDAYATGQTLYALSFAAVENERPEIKRAVAFLVATQRDDGSWPMTSRNHPGIKTTRKPIRNPVPITYFGSAWAALGLVRSVPTAPDTASRQQRAFDQIQGYGGKYELDENAPGRPVMRVDLRSYEVEDQEVENFTKVLRAFPRLATLQFKSTKITDAGLTHLKRLPQLRSLAIENATITDSGLANLKVLTCLENLNIKGAKVTDAGIQEFQKALPKVKVER